MKKATNINDFLNSLPRITSRRVWKVMMDGVCVQCVSATDNRKSTAEAYISRKYPGKDFTLVFSDWRMKVV